MIQLNLTLFRLRHTLCLHLHKKSHSFPIFLQPHCFREQSSLQLHPNAVTCFFDPLLIVVPRSEAIINLFWNAEKTLMKRDETKKTSNM